MAEKTKMTAEEKLAKKRARAKNRRHAARAAEKGMTVEEYRQELAQRKERREQEKAEREARKNAREFKRRSDEAEALAHESLEELPEVNEEVAV